MDYSQLYQHVAKGNTRPTMIMMDPGPATEQLLCQSYCCPGAALFSQYDSQDHSAGRDSRKSCTAEPIKKVRENKRVPSRNIEKRPAFMNFRAGCAHRGIGETIGQKTDKDAVL